jgi:4-hydroxy-2-oxoglutarate aldolase
MVGGSPGGTVSLANSFPEIALGLYELGRSRNRNDGPVAQERVSRINRAISGAYGVPGVKAAMDLAGFVGGRPRRPLLPLTDSERQELRATLEAEGLL